MGRPPIHDRPMTGAERQRRYIAPLKAAATQAQAQGSTGLRQGDTALRQKVAMLEQKLAQQRAMAQPGQQAADLPNGKIAQAEAQKNRAPPPTHRLEIQPGTPKEAEQAIKAVWERLDDKHRPLLLRFATYPVMLSEVWPKLPADKQILEQVLLFAIVAWEIFPTRQPHPKSSKAFKRWAAYWFDPALWVRWQDPTQLLLQTCAWLADKLANALEAAIADNRWSDNWRGDPTMNSRMSAVQVLRDIAKCFVAIDNEDHAMAAKAAFPHVGWNDLQARERFFDRRMSQKLEQLCSHKHHSVVDALSAVAADNDGPGREKVRSRYKAAKIARKIVR